MPVCWGTLLQEGEQLHQQSKGFLALMAIQPAQLAFYRLCTALQTASCVQALLPVCRVSPSQQSTGRPGQRTPSETHDTPQISSSQTTHTKHHAEQQAVFQWSKQATAAVSAAVFAAAAVLAPMSVSPAAAHEHMDHSMAAKASSK